MRTRGEDRKKVDLAKAGGQMLMATKNRGVLAVHNNKALVHRAGVVHKTGIIIMLA